MESVNSVNSHMHQGYCNVGIINPPDKFYKPVLYSDRVASAQFNAINNDIYTSVQHSRKLNEKKTPASVFVTIGLAVLAIAFSVVKRYIK